MIRSARLWGTSTLIVLIALWGALVPFFGPAIGLSMGPEGAWQWSLSNGTLHVAPGLGAIAGALTMLARRVNLAKAGAWLAVISGAWFLWGMVLSSLWTAGGGGGMMPSIATRFAFHFGPGVLITGLAGYALGLLTKVTPETTAAEAAAREDYRERELVRR